MSIFNRLEKTLEKIIEGTLVSPFGSKIQPIEIARILWSEITNNKRVGIQGTYVPNLFTILLSPSDIRYLEPIRDIIEKEIIAYLMEESGKRDFKTVGPIILRWSEDKRVKNGKFSITSDFVPLGEFPNEIRKKYEAVERIGEEKIVGGHKETKKHITKSSEYARLEESHRGKEDRIKGMIKVIEGFDKGKSFRLTNHSMTVGRSDTCDISIGDPRVSRKHAVVAYENGKYVIEDAGSKTGVFVNGKKVKRWVLEDGDEIVIGMTKMVFEGGR